MGAKNKDPLLGDSSRAQRGSELATSGATPRGEGHVFRILEALPQDAAAAGSTAHESFPTQRTSPHSGVYGGKVTGNVPALRNPRWCLPTLGRYFG